MASAVDTQKIASRMFVKNYDHDPGGTTAVIVSPDGGTTIRTLDMRDYKHFGVLAMISVLGTAGAITKLEIIASESSDMSSPVVVKDSGTVDADAVEDQLFLECTAEEIAKLLADARYVAGRVTMDAADAEAVVTYIGIPGRFKYEDLTPATTIA